MKTRTLIISIIILLTVIIISIIYTTVPRLELSGIQNMTISYREPYEEPGVILKNANTKYLNKVKMEDNIENEKIGNYYVDYTLKLGTRTLKRRRNIRIIDDIPPVIKLEGNQITEISINKEYIEPGYKAIDEYDGDLTERVEVIGKVDTENYGEYIIKYKVKDNSNNTVEVNRIVKVIDEETPKIVCETNYSAFEINTEKIIGCKAIDNFDGDITERIKITGEYDTSKKGIYNINYSVEDDAGNKTSTNHNIMMYESQEKTQAYVIINDQEEIKDILEKKEINATIINAKNKTEEYLKDLKEKNYQIGLKIKDKTFRNLKELEEYCNNNHIIYIDTHKTLTTQEINELLNNNHKKIIMIEKKENIETAKTIIELLKEMKYDFKTLDKIN